MRSRARGRPAAGAGSGQTGPSQPAQADLDDFPALAQPGPVDAPLAGRAAAGRMGAELAGAGVAEAGAAHAGAAETGRGARRSGRRRSGGCEAGGRRGWRAPRWRAPPPDPGGRAVARGLRRPRAPGRNLRPGPGGPGGGWLPALAPPPAWTRWPGPGTRPPGPRPRLAGPQEPGGGRGLRRRWRRGSKADATADVPAAAPAWAETGPRAWPGGPAAPGRRPGAGQYGADGDRARIRAESAARQVPAAGRVRR